MKNMSAKLQKTMASWARDLCVADIRQFFQLYNDVPELAEMGSPVRLLHDVHLAFQLGSFDWDDVDNLQTANYDLEREVNELQGHVDELESDGKVYDDLATKVNGARESLQDALDRLDDLAPNDLRDTLQVLIKRLAT